MRIYVVFVLLFFGFNTVSAQQNKADNRSIFKSHSHDLENPYSVSFKKDWAYILAGTGLATAGYLIKTNDPVAAYTQTELDNLNRNDINALDRGATYNNSHSAEMTSDIIVYSSLVVLPSVFLLNHHTEQDIVSLLVLSYEVLSINYGINAIVKSAVNRPRPYVYNPDLSYEERIDAESRFSFYSGHTTFTASVSFLFAKVMTDYHPDMSSGYKIGIWSFAVLLPATTGYLRIEAGKHYPTDVITGFAIGAATGWLIPQLHKSKSKSFSMYPTRVFNASGIGFTLKF